MAVSYLYEYLVTCPSCQKRGEKRHKRDKAVSGCTKSKAHCRLFGDPYGNESFRKSVSKIKYVCRCTSFAVYHYDFFIFLPQFHQRFAQCGAHSLQRTTVH